MKVFRVPRRIFFDGAELIPQRVVGEVFSGSHVAELIVTFCGVEGDVPCGMVVPHGVGSVHLFPFECPVVIGGQEGCVKPVFVGFAFEVVFHVLFLFEDICRR